MSSAEQSPAAAGGRSTAVRIREATAADVELIHSFIVELADYERAPEQVTGTPELLAESLFGPHPAAEALIAELDGAPVGFAIFHGTFSTWECRPGIWLEDLYVPDRHRRAGVGRALLSHLAALTIERGSPGWSGTRSTGTRRRWISTRSSERRGCRSGSCTASRAMCSPASPGRRASVGD